MAFNEIEIALEIQGRLGVAVGRSHKTTPNARTNSRGTRGHEGRNIRLQVSAVGRVVTVDRHDCERMRLTTISTISS